VDAILETVPNKSLNYLKPLCGLPISPYFSALKLHWLIENVPKVRQAVDEKRCCVGTVDTWLIWVIMLLIIQSMYNVLIV
jgi:glycerol kinase